MKACTSGSSITRKDLGNRRCFFSMRIYEHLKRQGMSTVTLAYELGMTPQNVAQTIRGQYHSERILDALRAAGVPEKYLFDPRRVEQPRKDAA